MKWRGIRVTDVKRWEIMYAGVDVVYEITKAMPSWLEGNRNKRKAYKKDWVSFIHKWLLKSQKEGK